MGIGFGVGFIEILVLGGLLLVGMFVLSRVFFSGSKGSHSEHASTGLFSKPVPLDCPFCGKETPANLPMCQHCQQALR